MIALAENWKWIRQLRYYADGVRGACFANKGIEMQTRVYLLFILFVVVAVFYATTRDGVSAISTELQVQTEMFDKLDEFNSETPEIASTSSGN